MFPVETISAKMLDYYVNRRDSLIIDLREREEFNKSHVRGAVNIPYEEADRGSITYHIEKAEYYRERVLNIPCSTQITEEDIEFVAECIKGL